MDDQSFNDKTRKELGKYFKSQRRIFKLKTDNVAELTKLPKKGIELMEAGEEIISVVYYLQLWSFYQNLKV